MDWDNIKHHWKLGYHCECSVIRWIFAHQILCACRGIDTLNIEIPAFLLIGNQLYLCLLYRLCLFQEEGPKDNNIRSIPRNDSDKLSWLARPTQSFHLVCENLVLQSLCSSVFWMSLFHSFPFFSCLSENINNNFPKFSFSQIFCFLPSSYKFKCFSLSLSD